MNETLKGKTILVVEDEKDLREPMATEFESWGCRVLQAKNGRDALQLIRHEKIDLVISDIRMPGGDGIELLNAVKAIDYASPIVMLITGFSDLSYEDAYHLGADAILAKPFGLDEMLASASTLLQPKSVRWTEAPLVEKIQTTIQDAFFSVTNASLAERFGLGRGGFFLRSEEEMPLRDGLVSFHIKFDEGDLLLLEGSGIVRWVRYDALNGRPRGFGVEFVTLTPAVKQAFDALTEKTKPISYLPKDAFVLRQPNQSDQSNQFEDHHK